MSIHKSIAKSAGIIGFATLCSRLLGFIRDIVIARLFGVYLYAQAFVIAFKIPNLFRDLFAEGASNAAFIPVFSEYNQRHAKEEFWELANAVLNLLLVILAILTLFGIIFSPILVRLIAPGFIADPEKLNLTIKLNRIIFPYVLLISLTAYATALLNSLKHFTVPAFAPCLLNISIIVFAIIFGEGITGLASGVLVGGLLQLIIQIPILFKKGFRPQFFQRFRHPAAKTIGKLMLPRVLSSCIYQLNNFVDSIFGSLAFIVGDGGVAVLYFAYRLIQFPLGIFSNSLAQVVLPTFSEQALDDNHTQLRHTLSFALRVTFFLILPASLGFIILSQPIVKTIFEGGRFDTYSTQVTANVLVFYSIGLVFYASNKILQSCFFALKDTLNPTKISAFALGLNIILNAALIFPLKISGIALATSISGICSTLILFFVLEKKIGGFAPGEIILPFLRILAASICMACVCYFLKENIPLRGNIFNKIFFLFILLLSGVAAYVIFCLIFRVSEIKELLRWVFKKRK